MSLLLLEPGPEWAQAVAAAGARLSAIALAEPVPNTYGMILLSRLPMTGRIDASAAARRAVGRGAADSCAAGRGSILHALHPEPPWPGDDSGERDAELVATGREVRNARARRDRASAISTTSPGRAPRGCSKNVAGMGDPRVGRGFYPTFNAKYPLLRWPLDHLFVTPHFEVCRDRPARRHRLGPFPDPLSRVPDRPRRRAPGRAQCVEPRPRREAQRGSRAKAETEKRAEDRGE